MVRWSAPRLLVVLLLLSALAPALPASAAAPKPDLFTVGANKVYAHTSTDDLHIWMNHTLDGNASPYYVTGAAAFTDPVEGIGVDPVANQPFEIRIPLTPTLSQAITLSGTVNVQAYIGGGTYTAGVASIATSLVADGKSLGAAAAKNLVMSPKPSQAAAAVGTTYDPIAWSFTVPATSLIPGAKLEWVISGTINAGNNIFMATYPARGSSYIELPVTAAGAPSAGASTLYRSLNGTTADIALDLANSTTALHQYNWTLPPGAPAMDRVQASLQGNITAGSVELALLRGNQTRANRTLSGHVNATLQAFGGAGNWTLRLSLHNATGTLRVHLGAAPVDNPSVSPTGPKGTNQTAPKGNATASSTSKGSPSLGTWPVASTVALAALLRRSRRRT